MSSAQRSRVLSPVTVMRTPSDLLLRTSSLPLGAGVATGVSEVDGLRTGGGQRTCTTRVGRTGWFRLGLCLVDVVFPLFDDLLGEVGDVLGVVGTELAHGEPGLALLRGRVGDGRTSRTKYPPAAALR
jgi:hypothetical protein